MMDIINPWGALRRARDIMERQAIRIGDLYEELDAHKKQIAEGHFRNPKTGRLGRKGVTYK
jgi:hypothetical protein